MHPKIESLCRYIYETESIYQATGKELDRFGEYVDLPRGNMSDDDYRNAILTKRRQNAASGTPPVIYYNTMVLTGAESMVITERKPASFNLHIHDDVTVPVNIRSLTDRAAAAGVSAYVTFSRGSGAFFLAGIEKSQMILGVQKTKALGVDETHVVGLIMTRGLGLSNLAGMNVTPLLLGVGGKILGVNGKALGLNKFKPMAETAIDNNTVYLAGTYDY
ncbi:hypothetical protein J0B02_03155 [Enterobacteriaceae bacterium YMB-R22]|uniref:hypothetical protein n=1 Tax=Tenebrionicola larvae TaxID=2815733 RepID=UPI0020133BBC|nr:hypothetical protein [Tenebrionicola larvae]MBV4411838.1 hypothetical protein [Tenebrionicola larvae]